MLIEFKVKNFKSFKEETSLNLRPAPKQKDLGYSIFKEGKGKKIKALCSSVIYGPNAAGKTNIIGAIEVLKNIVSRGNIRNADDVLSSNFSAWKLELIPNISLSKPEPTEFFIEFYTAGKLIQYALHVMFGKFSDDQAERYISLEKLTVDRKLIFLRKRNREKNRLEISNYSGDIENLEENLDLRDLFLTNGFKANFDLSLVNTINDWFSQSLAVIYRSDSVNFVPPIPQEKKNVYIDRNINEMAKIFGATSKIGYVYNEKNMRAQICSCIAIPNTTTELIINTEFFESYGTVRFINLLPIVLKVFQNGGTLIADEFDASIHPMALMSLINIFHNDEINKNHAQLIFNTHNPIFLNANLFRRDEIKLVDRDDDTKESTIYSLSDFGTSGEDGVRRGDDYIKHYMISRYGAIRDIDFSSAFEKILSMPPKKEKQ